MFCELSFGRCFGGLGRVGGGGEGIWAERDLVIFGREGDGLEVGARDNEGLAERETGLLSSSLESERLTGPFKADIWGFAKDIVEATSRGLGSVKGGN